MYVDGRLLLFLLLFLFYFFIPLPNVLSVFFLEQEAQLNEVLSASNLDPTALTVVTRKLEVISLSFGWQTNCLVCRSVTCSRGPQSSEQRVKECDSNEF